jgi:drug/metabolite transporter (DMT)-like permease
MKEKLKGHSAMFTANFLWGIMSPISKAIFLTGTISAFSLTNMRMAGAAILFWIASLFMPREPVTKRDLLLLFVAAFLYSKALPIITPIYFSKFLWIISGLL